MVHVFVPGVYLAPAIDKKGKSKASLSGSDVSDFFNGTIASDVIIGWLLANPPGYHGPVDDSDVIGGLGGNDILSGGAGDDRILRDSTTGTLYFDADASGAGAAVAFAPVTEG